MIHLSKKILIGISLVLSFGITMALSTILTPPFPRLGNIIAALEKIQQYKTNFSFPKITLPFSQKTSSGSVIFSKTTPVPTTSSQTSSTTTNKIPTIVQPSESEDKPANTPTPFDSAQAKPTNTPKPTKKPKATPKPTFILTNPRPGKNFQEAADIISPIICIPPAMIMATLEEEYGTWMAKVQSEWVDRNTYKGSDPYDAPGSTDIGGVMQMMGDTWHKIKPYVAQKLGTSELSLGVTFDAMAAGGYHLRNVSLAMQDKISCDDWPVKYILYGACRYNGACAPGATTYNQYSYDVCNNYNKYTKGSKKKCQ